MDEHVRSLIESLPDAERQADSRRLVGMMTEATGDRPELWYGKIVGFGRYPFRYASGRTGEEGKIGFAPGGRDLTIYLVPGLVGYEDLLDRLGKHRRGKTCVYIRRLSDVDEKVLTELVDRSVRHVDQVVEERGALPRMSEMPPYRAP